MKFLYWSLIKAMKQKKCLVIIQSRLNSSRLPGKALLPINGVPLVVLSTLRAGNTGKEVLVATSDEKIDDEICVALDNFGIKYFRGNLNDVLSRFFDAINSLEDEDLVFRLTADNVLPDGNMLDEMEKEYIKGNCEILHCIPRKSNLPYGVCAELTKAKHIRDAFKNAKTDYEREHVTPYIYEKYLSGIFRSSKTTGLSNFRLTIDTFDDYISVKSLFEDSKDIINESIQHLIYQFKNMRYRPFYEQPEKPMTLGTVQMGMNYGISNFSGKISEHESIEIIRQSITEGIEYIDTASAYGDSEKIIGKALKNGWSNRVKVITKLNPFSEIESCDDEMTWKFATRASVFKSCFNLGLKKIDTLMLHRASHLKNIFIMNELQNLRQEGVIKNIGISVQSPLELENALDCNEVSIIQMPFNILDYRWDKLIPKIVKEKEGRSLLIHARSSLLQGLLQSSDEKMWNCSGISNYKKIISWLNNTCKEHYKISVTDLCIGYVNSQPWVDSVVIGVDSLSHLYSNLQSISMPLINDHNLNIIKNNKPYIDESGLNPSEWKEI